MMTDGFVEFLETKKSNFQLFQWFSNHRVGGAREHDLVYLDSISLEAFRQRPPFFASWSWAGGRRPKGLERKKESKYTRSCSLAPPTQWINLPARISSTWFSNSTFIGLRCICTHFAGELSWYLSTGLWVYTQRCLFHLPAATSRLKANLQVTYTCRKYRRRCRTASFWWILFAHGTKKIKIQSQRSRLIKNLFLTHSWPMLCFHPYDIWQWYK